MLLHQVSQPVDKEVKETELLRSWTMLDNVAVKDFNHLFAQWHRKTTICSLQATWVLKLKCTDL